MESCFGAEPSALKSTRNTTLASSNKSMGDVRMVGDEDKWGDVHLSRPNYAAKGSSSASYTEPNDPMPIAGSSTIGVGDADLDIVFEIFLKTDLNDLEKGECQWDNLEGRMRNAPLAVSRLLTVVFDGGDLSLSLAKVDDRARTAGDAVAAVDVINEEAHGDRCGDDSGRHVVNRVLWM